MTIERRLAALERLQRPRDRVIFRVTCEGREAIGWEERDHGAFTVLWPIYDEEAENGND